MRTVLLVAITGCEARFLAPEGAAPDRDRDDYGAIVDPAGTTFRVWAPNADAVSVVGDFDGWVDDATPLASERDGNWSAVVPEAVPGDQYKFVIHRGATKARKADPRARQMTNSVGNSVIYDPDAYGWASDGFVPPAADDLVIYELHVGTLVDSPGGKPGTFTSAIERLDHLADLGISAIELLPVVEFPGDFSWGYNPSHLFAPESIYGDPDDLKHLVDEAHLRGIAVLVDVVHNHWGPSDLALWCFDLECYGKGGIYFYTDSRGSTPWGPRPDYGRDEVHDYIRDNAALWLGEFRADGLRWDSTVNIRRAGTTDLPDGWALLQEVNDDTDALMIAEDLQGDDALTTPVADGGAGFDAQWSSSFGHTVLNAIVPASDDARSMRAVADAIEDGSERVIYTESHDEVANGDVRIPERIDPAHPESWAARKRSTLGAAVVMTSPGIPMLFQGQEILEIGSFSDTDPVDWSREVPWAGIRDLYRDLVALRRNLDGNSGGLRGDQVDVYHVNDGANVLAWRRWSSSGEDVVVVANFSNRSFPSYLVGMPRPGRWNVLFNSDSKRYGADFAGTVSNDVTTVHIARDGFADRAGVGIGPYSVVILSQ